jgi:hypothetical protein
MPNNIFNTPTNSFESPIDLKGDDISLSDPSFKDNQVLSLSGNKIYSGPAWTSTTGVGSENKLLQLDENGNVDISVTEIDDLTINNSLTLNTGEVLFLGENAGDTSTGVQNTGVGYGSLSGQSSSNARRSTAVGFNAGKDANTDSIGATSLGWQAGVGCLQGSTNLGLASSGGLNSVNIGYATGDDTTFDNDYSVNVGYRSGLLPGHYMVNIGAHCNSNGAPASVYKNSIVINASGSELTTIADNCLQISECRLDDVQTDKLMHFNTTTKEVTYSNDITADDIEISIDILPTTDATSDLGSAVKRFNHFHVSKIYTNDLEATGHVYPDVENASDLGKTATPFRDVITRKYNGYPKNGERGLNIDHTSTTSASTRLFNGASDLGGGSSDRCIIYADGDVENTNNSYGAISDERLKENIIDAPAYLDKLMNVQVRKYNLISDPDFQQVGVIAQELQEVFPKLVKYNEEEDQYSVKYSVFIPILIKSLQEQQEMIEDLTTRIAMLEA